MKHRLLVVPAIIRIHTLRKLKSHQRQQVIPTHVLRLHLIHLQLKVVTQADQEDTLTQALSLLEVDQVVTLIHHQELDHMDHATLLSVFKICNDKITTLCNSCDSLKSLK